MNKDFLQEVIEERTRSNLDFPQMVGAALQKRRLLRELGARREQLGFTQVAVAKRMGTSQSGIARIEAGEVDVKLSTIERYAAAIGFLVEWELRPNTHKIDGDRLAERLPAADGHHASTANTSSSMPLAVRGE
jgi:transcriptional regulator with XRE-family HTH domain